MTAVLAVAVGALRARAQQLQGSGQDLEIVQVKPDFYMIAGAGANIAVQVGSLGAILVDTGTAEMSDEVLAAIGKLTRQPIRYIINTSAEPDHVGGNQKFSKAGATVLSGAIGQRGIDEDTLTNGGAASILAHENVLQRMSRPNGAPEALWPTKVYTGRAYSMYLNDAGIQVLYQPAAHSDGDSIVFFRQPDVIVTGDIVDLNRFPVIDPAKMLTRATELDPGFADAWGLLAQAYAQMGGHLDPDAKWFDLGEQAIARTLELDPVQCDALCARSIILWWPSRKFQNRAALRALNAALKINPLRQTARHQRSAVNVCRRAIIVFENIPRELHFLHPVDLCSDIC